MSFSPSSGKHRVISPPPFRRRGGVVFPQRRVGVKSLSQNAGTAQADPSKESGLLGRRTQTGLSPSLIFGIGSTVSYGTQRGIRKGVTLLEVLLTLAVLVLMGGIAWPVFSRAFENQRLKKSADILRAEWTQARVRAMSTGYVYIFQFTPGDRRYSTYQRAASEVEASSDGKFQAAGLDTLRPFGKEQTLPEGVTFTGGEVVWDTRAEMYGHDTAAFLSQDQGWSGPIFFYPDGTTSTARVVLTNERGRRIEVSLRSLTGMVSISEIYTSEEGQP